MVDKQVMGENKVLDELTEREMEVVTTVFKSFETGLREATIYPKVCWAFESFCKLLITL